MLLATNEYTLKASQSTIECVSVRGLERRFCSRITRQLVSTLQPNLKCND
jgi:hypothetical protein